MKYIGLDVGNGSVGMMVRNEQEKSFIETFPSVYGEYDPTAQSVVLPGQTTQAAVPVFTLDRRDYVLGYESVRRVGAVPISAYDRENRLDRKEFHTLTRLALLRAATADGATGVIEVALAYGTPAEDYRGEAVTRIESWFAEPIVGAVSGQQVIVMVRELRIISQPIAVLMDAYLDEQAQVVREDLEHSKTLILDCGSGTLDMSAFDGMTLKKQVGEAVGINDVYQAVIEGIVRKEPKARISAFDLEYQLREQDDREEKVYAYGRFECSVTELREQAMARTWERLIGAITRWFPDRLQFTHVFLAGGTGEAFTTAFATWMPSITLLPDPQLAVARGLCKYAQAAIEEPSHA